MPTISAGADVPSEKLTEIRPPSAATSTTWLLVRISPSSLKMIPEPDPEAWAPLTLIFTTEGSTELATCSTEPSAAGMSEESGDGGGGGALGRSRRLLVVTPDEVIHARRTQLRQPGR